MKLRLVEKKKRLHEADMESVFDISMKPSNFIKLTTTDSDYDAIESFIKEHSDLNVILNKTFRDRRGYLTQLLGHSKTDTPINILAGVLNWIKPSTDFAKTGAFDEEKSLTPTLGAHINDDGTAKIISHEGRNKCVYLWLTNEKSVNVTITLDKPVKELPQTFIPQFSSVYNVSRSELGTQSQSDVKSFKTVGGFLNINNINMFVKEDVIEEFNKKSIRVGGEDAILFKGTHVSTINTMGLSTYGLYKKDVKNVSRNENTPKHTDIEYWKKVQEYRFSPDDGPVTVS